MSSITFGSVSNVLSLCLLAKNIVEVLDNARGSAAEYRSLVTELRLLEKTLLEVELVAHTRGNTRGNNQATASVFSEIPDLIGNARTTLEALRKEVRKYEEHLGRDTSSGTVVKVGKKVRWGLSVKDKIADFRTQIATHSNAINMMLMTANV